MKLLFATLIFLTFSNLSLAQNSANDILGYYMDSKREGIIKIFEKNNKYYGKLVWMNIPDREDYLNPDTTKRKEKILGQIIMKGLSFNGTDCWEGGTIYNSRTGKTYKCKITREPSGNLLFRGYLGVSIVGQTAYFVKVDFKE